MISSTTKFISTTFSFLNELMRLAKKVVRIVDVLLSFVYKTIMVVATVAAAIIWFFLLITGFFIVYDIVMIFTSVPGAIAGFLLLIFLLSLPTLQELENSEMRNAESDAIVPRARTRRSTNRRRGENRRNSRECASSYWTDVEVEGQLNIRRRRVQDGRTVDFEETRYTMQHRLPGKSAAANRMLAFNPFHAIDH